MSRQPGVEVKLLLIGGLVGLVIGVVLTAFYFSLATFFAVNAKALEATQKVAENGHENAKEKSKPDELAKPTLALVEKSVSHKR